MFMINNILDLASDENNTSLDKTHSMNLLDYALLKADAYSCTTDNNYVKDLKSQGCTLSRYTH